MFTKIYHKLSIGISLFIILIVVVENIIIFISIKNITYPNFKNSVNESCNLAYNNVESYLSLTTSFVDNTISKKSFLDDVTSHRYNLNSLKIPSLNVLGVTLYTENNLFYSDGMGGIVSFETLKQDPQIKSFIDSKELLKLFSVRYDEHLINNNYNTNVRFDKSYGIISYICKVFEGEEVKGFLFVDLNLKELYHTFFTFSAFEEMRNSKTFIKCDNESYLSLTKKSNLTEYSSKKYLFNDNRQELNLLEIVTIVPKGNFNKHIVVIYLPIFLVSILIMISGVLIGIKHSHKITSSLTSLNNQMHNIDQILEDKLDKRR